MELHDQHAARGAHFGEVNGAGVVLHHGDVPAEHAALRATVGVVDLSGRSRLCLLGNDRAEFLHGQVTNDVKSLAAGQGCYAALVNHKGRMQADLNIWRLADELLLDGEPGMGAAITARLEKFIVAEDVQVADAAPHFGLLSAQGPRAAEAVRTLGWALPEQPLHFCAVEDGELGSLYLMNHPRVGTAGFDLFAPVATLGNVAERLIAAAQSLGGRACGWDALEIARIEAGIPRFGVDMDETNLPPEAGIESRAISYRKGCYIGQEVLNRLKVMGHVNRMLCGLRLAGDALPVRGDKLFNGDREVGRITSAVRQPMTGVMALGYVRRDCAAPGSALRVETKNGSADAVVAALPFEPVNG